MNNIQTVTVIAGEFGFCEICSNPTPRVDVSGEIGCQYCWEAYGEINQALPKRYQKRLDKVVKVCQIYLRTKKG